MAKALKDFTDRILNKHEALVAECLIADPDIDDLNDTANEDDPEDGLPADYSFDADALAHDVQAFSNLVHSKGKQFKVAPGEDEVVSVDEYKKLNSSAYKDLAQNLSKVNNRLKQFVEDYEKMKAKGNKTSEFVREDRDKIPYELNGLNNSVDVITGDIIDLEHQLDKVWAQKKANNVKSNLTADDLRPFIKRNNKLIKKYNNQ